MLSYGANDVVLGFAQTASFSSAGTTPNQRAVGQCGAEPRAGQSGLPGAAGADAGRRPAGASSRCPARLTRARRSWPSTGRISPAVPCSIGSGIFRSRRRRRRVGARPVRFDHHARGACAATRPQSRAPGGGLTPANYTVWGQAVGDFGRIRGDGNAATVTSTLGGFALGIDSKVDAKPFDNWRVGISGGYTSDNFSVAGGGQGTFENVFGTLYGGARYGAVDVRLGASYGGTMTNIARTVAFPGFVEAERANYGGSVAQGFGELGYRFALPRRCSSRSSVPASRMCRGPLQGEGRGRGARRVRRRTPMSRPPRSGSAAR